MQQAGGDRSGVEPVARQNVGDGDGMTEIRIAVVAALVAVLLLVRTSAFAQPPAASPSSDVVDAWKASGQYFTWRSTLPGSAGRQAQVFYTCQGDAAKPAVLLVHGFPTSSLDFRGLMRNLQADTEMRASIATAGNAMTRHP